MADILIYPWPIASHAMATLKIAKTLRLAGHTVVYVTVGAENPVISESGFVQEVILSEERPDAVRRLFSNGSKRQVNRFFRESLPGIVSRLESAFEAMVKKYRFELAPIGGSSRSRAWPWRDWQWATDR